MSDTPQGPGWWMADDQLWYPPHLRLGASTVPPVAAQAPSASVMPSTRVPTSKFPWKGIAAGSAVLALALVATVVFLLTRNSDTTPASTTTTSVSTTTAPATSTTTSPSGPGSAPPESSPPTTAPVAASPTAGTGGIANEAPGLLCKDLKGKGYSYPDAVDYWRAQGQPGAMDADKNGIPCETVYSERDVTLYWGSTGPVADGSCPSGPTLLAALRATPQLDDATGSPKALGQIQCALPFATAFDTTPGDGETAQILFKAINGYWVALDGGTSIDCQDQWSIPTAEAEKLGC